MSARLRFLTQQRKRGTPVGHRTRTWRPRNSSQPIIENAILANDYHVQFMSILEVLAASIDAKDPLTANHSQKVNEYAKCILFGNIAMSH